jgi:hypothetical protein
MEISVDELYILIKTNITIGKNENDMNRPKLTRRNTKTNILKYIHTHR